MATAAKKTVPSSPKPPSQAVKWLGAWAVRNRYYLLAFFIPVVLVYVAYAIFGMYPFGDRSVLCLDLNGQYIYYFEALRDAFHGDGSILYNWSRNLSGGYNGIIGYYLASPFTLIVMLLPRSLILGSMMAMILCKLGAASLTFCYFLQKSKGLKPIYAVILSVMYGMCAYGVIQTIDPMWLDGMVFLPLICLGVEYLVDDGRKLNYIFPLAIMCVANFYIGFMCCIFTAFYFLYYVCFGSDKLKYKILNLLKVLGRMVLATAVAMFCAAFMILPVYNALGLGKFEFTTPDYRFATQFTPLEFFAQFCVNSYNTVDVQGKPEIYCGALALLILPLFYINQQIKLRKKIGMSFLAGIMFVSMYIKPIDMLWHGGQMPNWLPFRYSFILSFILLTMAGMTLKRIRGINNASLGSCFILLTTLLFIINNQHFTTKRERAYVDFFGTIIMTVIFLAVYTAILYFLSRKNPSKRMQFWLPIVLLTVVGGEATYNAVCTFKDIHTDVCYSTRKSYRSYLESGRELVDELYEKDPGFYRAEKTYVRTVNDNAGFKLRGLTHSSSVMNTQVLKFIEAMGYSCRSYYSRYDGNTPIADSLLGIKYVLDKGDNATDLNPTYELQFTKTCKSQDEKDIEVGVYKNPNALSMGYMVDSAITKINAFGNDNPFNSQNLLMSTISGKTKFTVGGGFESWAEYYYPINMTEPLRLNAVHSEPYGAQTNYRADANAADPTIDLFFEAQSSDPIYIFFKTENESKVNLWLADQWNTEATCKNVDGTDGKFMGQYFETDNYHILLLGQYEKGQKLQLRMTLLTDGNGKEKYTIVKNFFFYHFNEALYQEDIDALKTQQWDMQSKTGRTLEGTITAKAGQIMMTSIPYEPGWTVWVDGQKTEAKELFHAMIGVELSEGTHTVKMRYTPPGYTIGLFLLVCGLFCIVMFYLYDRKNNQMLLLIYENRKKGIYTLPVEEEPEPEEPVKTKRLKKSDAVADEIRKLRVLADEGILTQEEFEAQKKKLLNL